MAPDDRLKLPDVLGIAASVTADLARNETPCQDAVDAYLVEIGNLRFCPKPMFPRQSLEEAELQFAPSLVRKYTRCTSTDRGCGRGQKTEWAFTVEDDSHAFNAPRDLYIPPISANVYAKNKKYLSGFKMLSYLQSAWDAFLGPMFQRPKRLQMAALCHRGQGDNKEYLLVTSRDTARWVIPKGWPIRGLNSHETALREAWEEAGVRNSQATDDPIGSYTYQKTRANGFAVPVETLVYSVAVKDTSEQFPEAHERQRTWVNAERAAELVNEAELKSIIRNQ